MTVETCFIEGLKIIKPRIFQDDRGYFFESFNSEKFNELTGENITFVQDNESLSSKNVLRGLHFQNPPYAQGKLVRVVKGSVLDVAVDIRKNSPTYGKHFSVVLSEENKTQFWVPEGFAHGFLTLEDNTIFQYKCTNFYHPESDNGIFFADTDLGIDWNVSSAKTSEKDEKAQKFTTFASPF